jgi:caffeoyl-CoA O-methyltransferase
MALLKAELTQAIVDYLARHSGQDDVLARIERETLEMPEAAMATPPDEGALLTMLARLMNARRALEVGTFLGYGAISIARGLGEGGRLTCLELEEKYAVIARANLEDAGVADRVEILVGPAEELLKGMPEEPTYDFAFLDADKTSYPTYYDLIVPRLQPGGLLVIDNVLLGGGVIDPQSERQRIVADLNDRITADERVESVMIFVADGVTLVRRRDVSAETS